MNQTRARREAFPPAWPALSPRWRTLRAMAVAAGVLLAACSDGGTTDPGPPAPSPNDPVAGVFALATVNTQPVPYALFVETGFRIDLTQSNLTLQPGGEFVLAITTVETVAGFASTFADTTRGTWTQAAGNVSLNATGGDAAAATWDGRQLGFELGYDGRTLGVVYRKAP
jgi:hypothetical protein